MSALDHLIDFLIEHYKWRFPVYTNLCDRCGVEGTRKVALGQPFPLSMELCPGCTVHVAQEAAKEYSGYLGLAAVYGLAYEKAARQRPVKPACDERSE